MTQHVGMRNGRAVAEDEVILAFLLGELESPRFGERVRCALARAGGPALVTTPDLRSQEQNEARRAALVEARGWGSDDGLFAGFPADVLWQHGVLEPSEVERVRYIRYSYWEVMSGGSRRPAEVRRTLERPDDLPPWFVDIGLEWPIELAAVIAKNGVPGEPIVVGTPNLHDLVVLEGHARLTALFVGGLQDQVSVPAYLGTSPNIRSWNLF